MSGADEWVSPAQFERNQGKGYPKTYPSLYSVVAVTDNGVIAADVNNSGVGSILKQSAGIRDTAGGGFPGRVSRYS